MRRRQFFSQLNPVDNRAPVPSGAGSGPAAAQIERPSPVSREEEEKMGIIWSAPTIDRYEYVGEEIKFERYGNEVIAVNSADAPLTPATDPTAAPLLKKKRGRPKGSKNKAR